MIAPSTIDSDERIQVCCVFLCRDQAGRLLLHRRTEACRDEVGTWDCGGGALEFGEDPVEAVRREVREEYGVSVLYVRVLGARNVLREQGRGLTHWVALVFEVLVDSDKVRIGEPHKMAELAWFDMAALPAPLHSQLREHLALLQQRRRGPALKPLGWLASVRLLLIRLLRVEHAQTNACVTGRQAPIAIIREGAP